MTCCSGSLPSAIADNPCINRMKMSQKTILIVQHLLLGMMQDISKVPLLLLFARVTTYLLFCTANAPTEVGSFKDRSLRKSNQKADDQQALGQPEIDCFVLVKEPLQIHFDHWRINLTSFVFQEWLRALVPKTNITTTEFVILNQQSADDKTIITHNCWIKVVAWSLVQISKATMERKKYGGAGEMEVGVAFVKFVFASKR
ncbi:hypothetical protein KCU85_g187, partial [Aureobasidium melanogenum]